jgi:hypothetical protein
MSNQDKNAAQKNINPKEEEKKTDASNPSAPKVTEPQENEQMAPKKEGAGTEAPLQKRV